MLIGVISDTHGMLPDIPWPHLDLFIHAGDAGPSPTNSDDDRRAQRSWIPDFKRWLEHIPAAVKVFVPGNHDLFMDGSDEPPQLDANVLISGGLDHLPLFGCAWSRFDPEVFPFPWSFGAQEADLVERYRRIPESTEILVSHAGVRGFLDNPPGFDVGSRALDQRTSELNRLRLVIHGHAHSAGGTHAHRHGALWINTARHALLIDQDLHPTILARFDEAP